MGLLDNLKRYIRGEDYDSDEYEDFNDPEESSSTTMRWTSARADSSERETSRASERASERASGRGASSYDASSARARDNVTSIRSNRVVNINTITQLSVVLIKPEKFENASEIADHLRDKRTVVLNLESTNRDIARRLLDFLGGVAYANEGKIKRIAQSTYIITPYNVDIQGDVLDELENNGLRL